MATLVYKYLIAPILYLLKQKKVHPESRVINPSKV